MNNIEQQQKFTLLLANNKRRNEPRRIFTVVEKIQEISMEKEGTELTEHKKTENNNLVFRFNDLTAEAKAKFSRILRKDSSLMTVRYLNTDEIINKLENSNPVIANG